MKSKNEHWLLFAALVLLLYTGLNPVSYFATRPHGDHAWAQCDRASVALNYYQFNYLFTEPHTHNIVYNPSGIATGECPLIPWVVAKLYNLFGYHEYIFRLFTLLLSLPSFFIAFKISKRYLNSPLLQISASLLWAMSPNLIYYSTGFLPDNIALTCFISGFYFLTKSEEHSVKQLLAFSLFASVGVLLKSSVLFLVAAVYMALLITAWRKGNFKDTFTKTLILAIPLFICVCWIAFARQSQISYNSNVFKLAMVLPGSLHAAFESLRTFALNLTKLYPLTILLALLPFLVLFLKCFKAFNFVQVFTLTALLMWAIFFVVMMRNAPYHGYYHIPFHFVIFTLSLSVFVAFEQMQIRVSNLALTGFAAFALLSFVLHSRTLIKISSHSDFINPAWTSFEPVLRQAGITNTDKVFTAYDKSYNVSLYLMNQQGWNCMDDVWDYYKTDGLKICDYAVLTDSTFIQQEPVKPYIGEHIASYNGVNVYRLKH